MIAQEVSEGGRRGVGGVLSRRYLQQQNAVDRALASVEPGQVSPVLDAPAGFWFFRVERKGAAGTAPWKEAPLGARQAHFRQELAKALGPEPESGGDASPRRPEAP
jgi:hypothetical protein